MLQTLTILAISLLSLNAIAKTSLDPYLNNNCHPSIKIKQEHLYNLDSDNSNNDLTSISDPYMSSYDKAYIYGRVLDEDCKPIPDVVITFWQTESSHNNLTELSGTTSANNLGEFLLATYIPKKEYPFIKGRVLMSHDEYFPFLTQVNISHKDSLEINNLTINSPWLLPNSDKYDQNNIYYLKIVIPMNNEKIKF